MNVHCLKAVAIKSLAIEMGIVGLKIKQKSNCWQKVIGLFLECVLQ